MKNIKIAHNPLTNKIYLYRHGKDPTVALDKRDAEADVFIALIGHMMYNSPRGSIKTVTIGEKQYTITVTPIG